MVQVSSPSELSDSTRVRVIFFDAGNTLLKPVESASTIYARTFRKWGLNVREEEVEKVFEATWSAFNARFEVGMDKFTYYPGGERVFWQDFVHSVMKAFGTVRDPDGCFNDLYEIFRRPETWERYPAAEHTLEILSRNGLSLGIISNWDSSLKSILDSLDLTRFFQVILISSMVGVAKPAKEIFLMAARAFDVTPTQCLHIGDSLHDDYMGAVGAGFQALLLDRKGLGNGRVPVVHSLEEVIEWVR
ncbi:MAG TPA: HAD-IA family hydrolase [Thermoanaerobaculia bacterium]|nr:HAD-IA family hydrolase [Thermoanaerobaculia bacterium]HUM29475.1 HAD-IA family hydrolase [Thermoanaerobaculia bacterium]HXK67858.1 HAD-IA family hydrolase [Thermoanaerobaculia bacterium]